MYMVSGLTLEAIPAGGGTVEAVLQVADTLVSSGVKANSETWQTIARSDNGGK